MAYPDDVPAALAGAGGLSPGHARGSTWHFEKDVPWDPDHPEQMRRWLEDLANQVVTLDDEVTVNFVSTHAAAASGGPLTATYQFVVCSGKRLMYPDADADDVGGVTDNDADDADPAPPDA